MFSSLGITISLMATTEKNHQVFAKCPNGTHKKPYDICEQVAPSENSGDDGGEKTSSIDNLGSEGSSNNDNKNNSIIY